MNKVNVESCLLEIEDYWNPRIAAELNGQQVRLVKILGTNFEFHRHLMEEEMFFVVKGSIELEFEKNSVRLNEGEFLVVPKGELHRPVAHQEAHLMMFVKETNINTGDVKNDFTLETKSLKKI